MGRLPKPVVQTHEALAGRASCAPTSHVQHCDPTIWATKPGPRLGAQPLLARANAGEALVELRDLPARINNALLAGPGRVRLRINVQANGIARLAVAGTGLELGPVGHDDVDLMIGGMDIGLHGAC